MSRVVRIKGDLIIENIEIAESALRASRLGGVRIENRRFVLNVDYYDGIRKQAEIAEHEKRQEAARTAALNSGKELDD